MQTDPDLDQLLASNPKLTNVKESWVDSGMTTLFEFLALHQDEALLLKDEMMVSYDAWDMMRKQGDLEHWEGQHALKDLAKLYNAHLAKELGFEAVAEGRGTGATYNQCISG